MQIRKMDPSELETVFQLWRETCIATYDFLSTNFTEKQDHDYFTNHIAAKNEMWLAVDDDQIVGFLAINGSYIDRLYIHPTQQHSGIGAALIDHAKTLSPAGLELHTHVKNINACGFYERIGFVAAQYGISAPPESEPDVEYHWRPSKHSI